MMLKKFRYLALAMALILVCVSCTTFAANKPIKIIYGHVWAKDHFYYTKGDLYFKKMVEKNSKGQILVEVYPASQLGSVSEQYQAVKSGAQQMTMSAVGELVPFWSELATFDLPYLYRDQKHFLKVADRFTSLIHVDEMAAKTGLRIVGTRIRASKQLLTRFPVNKLEDIKGLKMRVSQSSVAVATWKALGTVPTVIPGADVYTALASGTVDGLENPFDSIYTSKVHEPIKYCALTAHKYEVVPMVVCNKWWNGLTAAQKKIIQDALDKSNKSLVKITIEADEEYKNLLAKEGVKFTKPDGAPFREKVKTVWKEFGDENLIKKIQAIK
jgi:tripartite ATP-independent transporter DctP family solute receptor